MTPEQVAAAWEAYVGTHQVEHRNALAEHYQPLVRAVARDAHRIAPAGVTFSEMVSAGNVGLLQAIAGYEPSRCTKFEKYAERRIRGAIQDEQRSADFVPRMARSHARKIERVKEDLRGAGGEPTDREIYRAMRVRASDLQRWLFDSSFREMRTADDPDELFGAVPGKSLETRPNIEQAETVAGLLAPLTDKERRIVVRYVVDGLTTTEIGREMEYTKGRINQILRGALGKLRDLHFGQIMTNVIGQGVSETKCFTRKEVAQELSVSIRTVIRLVESNEIPEVSVGRVRLIRQVDLLRYLENKRAGKAGAA